MAMAISEEPWDWSLAFWSSSIERGEVLIDSGGIEISTHVVNFDWGTGSIDWSLPTDLERTTVLAVGDILMEGSFLGIVEQAINTRGGDFLFHPTKRDFSLSDIVIGNLENPLSQRGSPIFKMGPHFRGSGEMAAVLKKAGFTVIGVANNHCRDYGDHAFLDTLSNLRHAGLIPVGGGQDLASAMEPAIVQRGDHTIGVFAFTYGQESVAYRERPGAASLDNVECFKAVKAFRDRLDSSLIYLHMDPEYSNYPAPHRVRVARDFIDAGADMVIGHHPHVPQGLEIYKGKLIAYSLGNFVFHTQRHRDLTSLGYMLKVELTTEGPAYARIIPYRIADCWHRQHALCQPIPLSGDDFSVTMKHIENISKGLKDTATINLNWQEIASMETLIVARHILRSISKGEPYPNWYWHLKSLKYRYDSFFKALATGRIFNFYKKWFRNQRRERA